MEQKKTEKKLFLLTVIILITCFMVMLVYSPVKSLNASAAVNKNQTQIVKQDSEKLIEVTREEYENLQEYSYSEEIETAMAETGMTVGESLVDQLCYYQGLLDSTTNEQEISKINCLIDETRIILDMYQTIAKQAKPAVAKAQKFSMDDITYAGIYALAAEAVPAAIAWFNASNYLLSAELLTHAWSESIGFSDYSPINGNRVVGSQVTYNFINSDSTYNDQWSYPIYAPDMYNTSTCYEEDLGFALHGVAFSRSNVNSTKIKITDTYDFEVQDGYNSIIANLVQIFAYAQSFGIIKTYPVAINIDVADALYLKLNSTEKGVHSISVHNFSNKEIEVAYNIKMCLPADAEKFRNISDIDFISIPANDVKTVTISENALASHITFCCVKDGYKIITYADELYLDRNILNTTFIKSKAAASDIALITKVGNKWLFNLTNIYACTKVEYNAKMCNKGDAQKWKGLKDVITVYLNFGKSKFVYISENWFATHIALRFIGDTYQYYIYANELNINGTMSIGRRTTQTF